ncbi:MAG: hypothetical protein HY717_09970 [Planctomycetes bacterium]|nr:hypothetical protein [Planctomycetota bacterium]
MHQDGLHALLKLIAGLPQVEKDNFGVVSSSLGLAMAAGALGRYPSDPPVKYFIDNDGPSDRPTLSVQQEIISLQGSLSLG